MGKFDVRADPARNRLYIIAAGFFTDAEVRYAADQLMSQIDQLRPGFVSISDFGNFKPSSAMGFEAIKAMQRYLAQKGVLKRIQIQPANALAQMQLKRSTEGTGVADMLPVASLAEAEQVADTLQLA